MIDYRDLLKKYIDHVVDCEGMSYLDGRVLDDGSVVKWGTFTDEEWAELLVLLVELYGPPSN